MRVTINGEERQLPRAMSLSELVEHLSLAPERLAIEFNREVVRRADWPRIALSEGDQLEIVHFVGGGCQSLRAMKD